MRRYIASLRRNAWLDIARGRHGRKEEARQLFTRHAAGLQLAIYEVYAADDKPPLIDLAILQRQLRLGDVQSTAVRRHMTDPRLRIELDRQRAAEQRRKAQAPRRHSLAYRIAELNISDLADGLEKLPGILDELAEKRARSLSRPKTGEDIEAAKRHLTQAISRTKRKKSR